MNKVEVYFHMDMDPIEGFHAIDTDDSRVNITRLRIVGEYPTLAELLHLYRAIPACAHICSIRTATDTSLPKGDDNVIDVRWTYNQDDAMLDADMGTILSSLQRTGMITGVPYEDELQYCEPQCAYPIMYSRVASSKPKTTKKPPVLGPEIHDEDTSTNTETQKTDPADLARRLTMYGQVFRKLGGDDIAGTSINDRFYEERASAKDLIGSLLTSEALLEMGRHHARNAKSDDENKPNKPRKAGKELTIKIETPKKPKDEDKDKDDK